MRGEYRSDVSSRAVGEVIQIEKKFNFYWIASLRSQWQLSHHSEWNEESIVRVSLYPFRLYWNASLSFCFAPFRKTQPPAFLILYSLFWIDLFCVYHDKAFSLDQRCGFLSFDHNISLIVNFCIDETIINQKRNGFVSKLFWEWNDQWIVLSFSTCNLHFHIK